MLAGAASVLGAVAGLLIARFVPDETGWYPRWFLLASLVFLLAAGIIGSYALFATGSILSWVSVLATGLLVFGIGAARVLPVALGAALLGLGTSVLALQLLTVGLIPAAGWLYANGRRTSFSWFLLIPTVIILFAFLV